MFETRLEAEKFLYEDPHDPTYSRLIDRRDGSVWPAMDTGARVLDREAIRAFVYACCKVLAGRLHEGSFNQQYDATFLAKDATGSGA